MRTETKRKKISKYKEYLSINSLLADFISYWESEEGPLFRLWEEGELGDFDDCKLSWADVHRLVGEGEVTGSLPLEVELYRRLLKGTASLANIQTDQSLARRRIKGHLGALEREFQLITY